MLPLYRRGCGVLFAESRRDNDYYKKEGLTKVKPSFLS